MEQPGERVWPTGQGEDLEVGEYQRKRGVAVPSTRPSSLLCLWGVASPSSLAGEWEFQASRACKEDCGCGLATTGCGIVGGTLPAALV